MLRRPVSPSSCSFTALSVILLLALGAGLAHAGTVAPAAAPVDTSVIDPLLAAIARAETPEARIAAAAALAKAAPGQEPALAAALARPRPVDDDARRAALHAVGADVPSKDGKFKATPPPRLRKGEHPPPELDWIDALAHAGSDPAVKDSFMIVAILRALVASQAFAGADAILEFAFTPDGIAFRDECGRQLRAMSPRSLPTLVRASQQKKIARGAYARYAAFQLDRLDKNRPSYALAAAPDDTVEIAILQAIAKVHHPDALPAVLERCDARSARVRRAAREAWKAYVEGPPPPPAPKAKRKMAGGKMSDEEMPRYLTYRELARQELMSRLNDLGAGYDKGASEADLTRTYFMMLDARRVAEFETQMKDAATMAAQGKLAEAAASYDLILVVDPSFARRAEMAPTFLALGRQLAKQGKWTAAALALEKAYSLDPAGKNADKAEAELHLARAQVLEAAGKTSPEIGDELAQAVAADPTNTRARKALGTASRTEAAAQGAWMLWAGIAAVVLALGLGLAAMVARKRQHA
jgi:tetratricopeptide (TPR) repeat protein